MTRRRKRQSHRSNTVLFYIFKNSLVCSEAFTHYLARLRYNYERMRIYLLYRFTKAKRLVSLADGSVSTTGQPSSDVLYFTLENGDKIIVRPSGTEPKIKIYILAHDSDSAALEAKVAAYQTDTKKMTEV